MDRRGFIVGAAGLAAAASLGRWGASALAAPDDSERARAMILGIGAHSLESSNLDLLQKLGMRHVRHTLYPNLWVEDPSYPRRFRREVEGAIARGFNILLVVHPVPAGWTPARFGRWLGERATEMPGVEAWQIGNEAEFAGGMARWQEEGYARIKTAVPAAKVVTMGFDMARPQTRRFVEAAPPMDALCFHVYGPPLGGRTEHLAELAREIYTGPLWITEFGVERKSLREEGWEEAQAAEWRDTIRAAERLGIERAYGYQLRTDEPLETHGVVRPDGSLRPVATWLQSLSAADAGAP